MLSGETLRQTREQSYYLVANTHLQHEEHRGKKESKRRNSDDALRHQNRFKTYFYLYITYYYLYTVSIIIIRTGQKELGTELV